VVILIAKKPLRCRAKS